MAGGGDTNKGRMSGEAVLLAAFAARNVPVWSHGQWLARAAVPGALLVRRFPFVTIYQTQGHVEFVLVQDGTPSLTIECKHQQVSGSCDEKLCYCLLNAVYQWPTRRSFLILSGDHWGTPRGQAAMAAMRRMAALAAPAGREFEVLDQQQALNWVSRTF